MTTLTLRRIRTNAQALLWVYLGLITLAELITSITSSQLGLILHALILVSLLIHGALGENSDTAKLALALTLAPLIRLLSLSMPLLSFPQMAWYPLVSIPLLLAMWIIVQQLGVPRRALGLQPGNLLLQTMLIGIGLGLGAMEYSILQPKALITELSWRSLALPALSLTLFTGFSEEIIFRGLLQSLARPMFQRCAFVYVALLFAVLHIGYLSFTDVLFVFAVGLTFAYVVHWGGSILGVTLAHGLTNIMLFLVMPYLAQDPASAASQAAPWIIGLGSGLAVLAIAILAFNARKRQRTAHAAVDLGATLRAYRRRHDLSYTALAQRTSISARELAAIEHQRHTPAPEHVATILEQLHDDES